MRHRVLVLVVLAACGAKSTGTVETPLPAEVADAAPEAAEPAPPPPTPAEAKQFMQDVDRELRTLRQAEQQADWAKQTDITPEHEAASARASEASMKYLTAAILASRRFDPIMGQLDEDTRRQIKLLRISGQTAPEDPAHAAELARITAEMDGVYGAGKACDAKGEHCQTLEELSDVMAVSRDPKVLLAAWKGWHDTVGKAERPYYAKFVPLANEGVRVVGFDDVGVMWRSGYEMTPAEFEAETDRLWSQVEPLYKNLHCYARRKLVAKYGKDVVPPKGPIPAHLLGNMWAQTWEYTAPLMEPYKGQPQLDVTPELVKQKYDPIKMARLAESFFDSLGLTPLPESFWQQSMFVKPEGKEVVCHASAWNMNYDPSNDVRIKMCIKINQEDLITLHHELGHDHYYLEYSSLPVLYQTGANDGFHEAIGDTLALSVTPGYLKQLGLLKKVGTNEKALINQQMNLALEKIAFLPWGLLVDKWRWDVFSGKVGPEQWNQHWWALRLKYQGIAPPEPRGEEFFDPGAKYHIPGNTPYMRYFLSFVMQFQFHRALCKASGHTGPLYQCSIFGSKAAGAKLKAMLALGASRPWPEALEAMTGETRMDASAILEYFAPLQAWLEVQNKGQECGW